MATLNDTRITFSTGKRLETYFGVVGLGVSDGLVNLEIFEGGESIATVLDYDYDAVAPRGSELTKEECTELADFMIAKWNEFKAKAA